MKLNREKIEERATDIMAEAHGFKDAVEVGAVEMIDGTSICTKAWLTAIMDELDEKLGELSSRISAVRTQVVTGREPSL